MSVVMFSNLQVVKDSARGNDSFVHSINSKALECTRLELLDQFIMRKVEGINPIIQCKGGVLFCELGIKLFADSFAINNFGRAKTLNEFVHIVFMALCGKEFSGANVKKGDT